MKSRWLGWAVLALTVVATGAYWSIIVGQGTGFSWIPIVVTTLLLGPGVASAVGSAKVLPGPAGAILLSWSALTLLSLASIAFSIGMFLYPIGLLALATMLVGAWSARWWGLPAAALGGLLGVATILGFLSLEPYLPPDCPNQKGHASGSTSWPADWLHPAVYTTWECQDGRLIQWQTSAGPSGPQPLSVSSGTAGP
jgi:hypothetical protein